MNQAARYLLSTINYDPSKSGDLVDNNNHILGKDILASFSKEELYLGRHLPRRCLMGAVETAVDNVVREASLRKMRGVNNGK